VLHRRGSLVKTIVGSLPVEDPHLQQVVKDVVCHLLSVQHQQILMRSDHVCPKNIIIVKVEEVILLPPFLNHKLISVLFPPESNPIGATTEDLALVNVCFPGNIIQYLPRSQKGKASGNSP